MEQLTAKQRRQVKKMSDDRLRDKLLEVGYAKEDVLAWGRGELLNKYAELVFKGSKPEEAVEEVAETATRATVVAVDSQIELQKLALEKQRLDDAKEEKRRADELERQRIDVDRQRLAAEMDLEKQKFQADRELEKQKLERADEFQKQKLELERQQLEYEKAKVEYDHQKWLAEQKRNTEDIQRQEQKERKEENWKNDRASRAKKYADAIRGSISPMGPDSLDALIFFKRVEQLFHSYEIPVEFQANIIIPFLNAKAKAVHSKLSPEVMVNYDEVKTAILRELKLSPNVYLERFNTCHKKQDETYVCFASRLRTLLDFYLESRSVTKFDELCNLLISDRIKSTLSDVCLKYILSVESGKPKDDMNWLSVQELSDSVDRFVASKGELAKPRAQFLGQNLSNRDIRNDNVGAQGVKGDNKRFGQNVSTPKHVVGEQKTSGPHFQTPVKSVICYECQRPGHIRSNCPKLKSLAAKRIAVLRSNADMPQSAASSGSSRPVVAGEKIGGTQCVGTGRPGSVTNTRSVGTSVSCDDVGEVNHVAVRTPFADKGVTECDRNISKHVIETYDTLIASDVPHHLSSLEYINVRVRRDENDSDGLIVAGLCDNGSQISVIKADLLQGFNPDIKGKIRLQPFFGTSVETPWVKLSVLPAEISSQGEQVEPVTIECAIVDNLNEDLILPANITNRLMQLKTNAVKVRDDDDDDDKEDADDHDDKGDVDDNDNDDCDVNDHKTRSNGIDVVNTFELTRDIDSVDNVGEFVADDNASDSNADVNNNESNIPIQQYVAEQKDDLSLKGCRKNAELDRAGFTLLNGLVYRKQKILGEIVLQLLVPSSRRKHVMELAHDICGGHQSLKRTKQRIELTFYWPTLNQDVKEYVKTCRICQLKKRKTTLDRVPITPIPRCDMVFDHMFLDCAGPFISGEGTKPKYNYALIAIDSYSRFPFAVPLRTMHAKSVCDALLQIWSFVGVCSSISTDLGTNFTSQLTRE